MGTNRRFLNLLTLAPWIVVLALPASGSPRPASAAPSGSTPPLMHGRADTRDGFRPDPIAVRGFFTGNHYLYVDDGGPGPNGGPDAIEVFRITGIGSTRLQTFPTGAVQVGWMPGANTLAYSERYNCLILASFGLHIESFAVNPSTHLVTGQASNLLDPNAFPSGNPVDVHVNSDGTIAYLADVTAKLSSWRVSQGCTLTYLSSSTGGNGSEGYASLTLAGDARLVAPDTKNSTIDSYDLGANGAITLVKKATSQLSRPEGITLGEGKLFTGQANYQAATIQGGRYLPSGDIAYFTGSPASDSGGIEAYSILFDEKHQTLVAGDVVSSRLSSFRLSGSPTTMAFTSATSLAKPGLVDDLTRLQSALFVNTVLYADIEVCRLGAGGASGCVSFATLANTGGVSNGLAIAPDGTDD